MYNYFNSSIPNGTYAPQDSTVVLNAHHSVTSIPETTTKITVLKSVGPPVNKRFYVAKYGEVQKESYQQAYKFDVTTEPVNNIRDLYGVIQTYSATQQHLLIRGLPVAELPQSGVRRLDSNFPEQLSGTPWVMLDFDDIPVPDGIDPLSTDAIEWVIARLPSEFSNASYIYQHSNSAGILRADGTPLKSGLNAHLFFWLDRPICGKPLAAYLKKHCLNTGFYSIGENKGGVVAIQYGIDPATVRSATQPHFISPPKIEEGVQCLLDEAQRQGLIIKTTDEVAIADLPTDIEDTAKTHHDKLRIRYQQTHGYVKQTSEVITEHGVSRKTYFANPNSTVRGGRRFVKGELSQRNDYFRLYFADEGSPGSWFVNKRSPQLARRFGDNETIPLRELSEGAFLHVRDELGWFFEIPHKSLNLVESGYLPAISSFATAKVSLVLSPTGSGKTHATIEWIKAKQRERLHIVYAAPTIALVNQMMADLRQARLQPIRYTEVSAFSMSRSSIIVTTNESLPKILATWMPDGYVLILDEFHQTLDGFMGSCYKNRQLETALVKAQQSLLLTGTLTEIQRRKIPEIVYHALGGVNEVNYCCYEFKSVKRNPLHILPLDRYDSDLVQLFNELSEKAKNAQPLPRTVLILPTSKLEAYRTMIEQFGLTNHTEIVSRPDNTQTEIEAARTSDKPILITSPLFSLGLNFEAAPESLWCRFDNLGADTNQIIQTVNRANRGQTSCEVRIYGTITSEAEFRYANPHQVKSKTETQFRNEASIIGDLDDHLQLDRVVYKRLRKHEKDSLTALSVLVRENAIQNYDIVPLASQLAPVDKDSAKIFIEHRKGAKKHYADAIAAKAKRYLQLAPEDCLYLHERLEHERRYNYQLEEPRIERDLDNEALGIIMGVCQFNEPAQAQKVKIYKIKRLFGEITPWTSGQYARDSCTSWAQVEAEKTENLMVLVKKLDDLRSGKITATHLAGSMTRNKKLQAAFLALSDNDMEYTQLSENFSSLRTARRTSRISGGRNTKAETQKQSLIFLRKLLEPLGITYGKKTVRGRQVTDLNKPIVPAGWDLSSMLLNLRCQSARLKALPPTQKTPMEDPGKFEHEKEVRLEVCQSCILFHQSQCAVGHPVDWQGVGWEGQLTDQCADFKRIPINLLH